MLLFAECYNRILRAEHHARTFINSYLSFLHDNPYGIAHEIRNDRNGVIKLVPQKVLDQNLPLILGEFFYQLRAALDAAMWRAFIHLGGSETAPNVRLHRLDFPIHEKSESFETATFHNLPLPNELKLWLDAIQPCHAHKRTKGSADDKTSTDLSLVHACARKDRHRQLHVVGTVVSSSSALIKVSAPATVSYVQNIPANPFRDEYEIATFGVEGMTSETEIEVNANFTIHVKVQEIPDDTDLMIRLFQLKDAVGGVIRRFEAAFK